MVEEKEGKREYDAMRRWVDNKTALTFHLVSGKPLNGILLWWDRYHLGVKLTGQREVFLFKHSILYIELI